MSGPDIVERLLLVWPGNGKYINPDGPKAAATITALSNEVATLQAEVAALRAEVDRLTPETGPTGIRCIDSRSRAFTERTKP